MDRAKIYHDMTDSELSAAYKSKKQELFNLRFQHSICQLKINIKNTQKYKDYGKIRIRYVGFIGYQYILTC